MNKIKEYLHDKSPEFILAMTCGFICLVGAIINIIYRLCV